MTEPQAPTAPGRGLDERAVGHVLRRLARQPEAPWLHQEVARRMAERLSIIRLQPERLVDWWSHLGAGAALLDRAYPKAQVLRVEPSDALAVRSRHAAQAPWWSAHRWTRPGAEVRTEQQSLAGGQQLVWSNMMLQWALEPPALFARWHEMLDVDGFVMFSCPGPATLRELRALYQQQGWGGATPAFIDMHDLGDMLLHAGFADPVMDQETLTLEWSSPQAMLDELRTMGGNTAPARSAGLRTQRWRSRLLEAIDGCRSANGRISATFEIAYGHAFKAAPRLRGGETTSVSLQDMRAMIRRRGSKPLG